MREARHKRTLVGCPSPTPTTNDLEESTPERQKVNWEPSGAGTGGAGRCLFRGRVWGEGVAGLDDETDANAGNVPEDPESYAENGYNGKFYIRFILAQ